MNDDRLLFVPAVHRKMLDQHYLLCYKGQFSQDITKSLLAMTESKLEKDGTEISIKKKIFKIMVGCLQNICKPGDNLNGYKRSAIFMLGKNEKEFFIFSGNVMLTTHVEEMKRKLYAINMMDSGNLRKLFKTLITSLSTSEISDSEIVLIDIARKSGRKLEFEFHEIDKRTSFFSMKTVIAQVNPQ